MKFWFRRYPMKHYHFSFQGLETKVEDIVTATSNCYDIIEECERAFRNRHKDEPVLLAWWTTDLTD